LRDGEVRDQDTEWGSVVPNGDGTYYTWASITALPGEKDKYRCRVDHASLAEPQLYAWETEPSLLPVVLGLVLAVLGAFGVIAIGVVLWR
ncbi:HA1F protein, partial [Nyctiprogne leucopyga]|nr:HA1F protein [Nyctiprogne leucopyga]